MTALRKMIIKHNHMRTDILVTQNCLFIANKYMTIRSTLFASIAIISFGLVSSGSTYSFEYAGINDIADDLGSASVSILDKLGYDCQNASSGAIVCKKCKADGFKQKCTAFVCDAATKKCRKKSATVPNIPGLGGSSDDDRDDEINLPSL